MQQSFTLIELIFVIVIIGLLASVAVPKFTNLATHAKEANIKSVITTVESSIDNIHGQWIINDTYSWKPEHGSCGLNSQGYPDSLDDNSSDEKQLFKCVLKNPVPSCGDKHSGCWEEYDSGKYQYKYSEDKKLKVEYNASNGDIVCLDGDGVTKEECEKTIY